MQVEEDNEEKEKQKEKEKGKGKEEQKQPNESEKEQQQQQKQPTPSTKQPTKGRQTVSGELPELTNPQPPELFFGAVLSLIASIPTVK